MKKLRTVQKAKEYRPHKYEFNPNLLRKKRKQQKNDRFIFSNKKDRILLAQSEFSLEVCLQIYEVNDRVYSSGKYLTADEIRNIRFSSVIQHKPKQKSVCNISKQEYNTATGNYPFTEVNEILCNDALQASMELKNLGISICNSRADTYSFYVLGLKIASVTLWDNIQTVSSRIIDDVIDAYYQNTDLFYLLDRIAVSAKLTSLTVSCTDDILKCLKGLLSKNSIETTYMKCDYSVSFNKFRDIDIALTKEIAYNIEYIMHSVTIKTDLGELVETVKLGSKKYKVLSLFGMITALDLEDKSSIVSVEILEKLTEKLKIIKMVG